MTASPKKVGDSLLIGGKPFQIVGIYETGSLLIDTTIVMEITTARELFKLDKDYVSVMYVEPEPLVDLDELADRIRTPCPKFRSGACRSSTFRWATSWASSTCSCS